MEKKKNLYTMFTKWSVSYIVLSVVAIGTIFYCSMRYTAAMKKELEYTNAVQMEMIQIQMDRTVANFRTFAKYEYNREGAAKCVCLCRCKFLRSV